MIKSISSRRNIKKPQSGTKKRKQKLARSWVCLPIKFTNGIGKEEEKTKIDN
jgi:hypothetical protein